MFSNSRILKVKVLILTSNYPRKNAHFNGIFIHQQTKALIELGVECHVLLLHNWFPPFGLHKLHPYWKEGKRVYDNYYTEYEGVKIHAVPSYIPIPNFISKENHYDRDARSIVQYVQSNRELRDADWIYAQFLTVNAYVGAKIKDRLNMKLAAIARGDDIHAWPEANPLLRRNFPLVFEKTDVLLANSRNLGKDVQKWMTPNNLREVGVVYNGIDTIKFRPLKDKIEKDELRHKHALNPALKYLVCIGTPVALKGWNELFEGINKLGSDFNGWNLLAIAPNRSGNDVIDLAMLANQYNITEKVVIRHDLPLNDIAEVLRASDAFILASYNEGMANSLLEAMASGLPCIITEVGGHNEVIESGEEGILIQPKSVTDIINALKKITSNEALRQSIGTKARDKMIQFGDYQVNARKLLNLLEQHK